MADVTATFGAKDVGVAATISRLTQRLAGFQASMTKVSAVAGRMQARFAGLRNSVVGLAAAYIGVSQVLGAFNKALEVGGRLDDLSKVTGESAGNLMLLEKAFELSGAGADKVGMALAGMARFINDLRGGAAGASETARRLGISLADLEGKTPIEQMRLLLEAIGGVTDANERLTLSMNVFKKVGKDLIPLATNFGGEMEKAVKQLGSAPALMNEFAEKLADVGDNMAAIGQKGEQFMMGFIAGARGIDDMTEAMANLDAAAAGFDFGKIISGAFQSPSQAFVALGELLLEGILKAMNALANAAVYADKVYAAMFGDSRLYQLIGGNLTNAVTAAAATFGRLMLEYTQTIISLLSKIPGMQMIDPFGLVTGGIQAAQDKLAKTASDAAAKLFSSMEKGSAIMSDAAKRVNESFRPQDYFGAAAQGQEAQAAIDRMRQLGTAPQSSSLSQSPAQKAATESAKTYHDLRDQLDDIYLQESDRLRALGTSTDEYRSKIELLKQQYDEALRTIERARVLSRDSAGVEPPAEQMNQATLSETVRQAVASEMNRQTAADFSAQERSDSATENTLQQAVAYLRELTGKLPQTALV